jgi:hypothetical protein
MKLIRRQLRKWEHYWHINFARESSGFDFRFGNDYEIYDAEQTALVSGSIIILLLQ